MSRLLLVRHGETEWSRAGRHTGASDVPLTEEGRCQALLLREVIAARRISRVLTSPLQRALETCRLAGLGQGSERLDDLAEWDYGEYEGLTSAQIRERRPGWWLWRDGCPGGEAPADVGRRADHVIEQVAVSEGEVAIFCHGHLLRVLAARWLGLEPGAGGLLHLSTATLSLLGHEHGTERVIWTWNAAASEGADPLPPV